VVDLEGYVNVHAYRYEVPSELIGRRVEVRETKSELLVYEGHRELAKHKRRHEGAQRVRLPESARRERKTRRREQAALEERELCALLPEFVAYILEVRKRAPRGRSIARLRKLRRMLRDYPRRAIDRALRDAAHYGLYELDRVESMVLRNVDRDFFPRHGFDDGIAGDGDREEGPR
jgi:hypothetical protein